MKRIIEAARCLLSGETGIVRQGKALVVTCAVGAMIAASAIVGTVAIPNPGQAHVLGTCPSVGGGSWCNWVCVLTGHSGGSCCQGTNATVIIEQLASVS